MPNQLIIPEPLFIADPCERLINMLVDAAFDRLVAEVEAEENDRLKSEAKV